MTKTRVCLLGLAVAALVALPLRGAATPQTFTGVISDDMCGLDHGDEGKKKGEKACTLECVETGSSFVLADREHGKVYKLDDQEKPKALAGEKVVVTGTLEGDTIHVREIKAAK